MNEPALALPERTKEDHCTPGWLLDIIRGFAPIGLDPCSNPWSTVNARHAISQHEGRNGLDYSWANVFLEHVVFVNPPYGPGKIMPWVEHATREDLALTGSCIIMLLPATPDTKWFRKAFDESNGLCFLSKRVAFEGAYAAGAKQPSALFYWGNEPERFAEHFKPHGIVIAKVMRQEVLVA